MSTVLGYKVTSQKRKHKPCQWLKWTEKIVQTDHLMETYFENKCSMKYFDTLKCSNIVHMVTCVWYDGCYDITWQPTWLLHVNVHKGIKWKKASFYQVVDAFYCDWACYQGQTSTTVYCE